MPNHLENEHKRVRPVEGRTDEAITVHRSDPGRISHFAGKARLVPVS